MVEGWRRLRAARATATRGDVWDVYVIASGQWVGAIGAGQARASMGQVRQQKRRTGRRWRPEAL